MSWGISSSIFIFNRKWLSLCLINQFGSISLWFIGRLTIKDSRPSLEFFTCQLRQKGVYIQIFTRHSLSIRGFDSFSQHVFTNLLSQNTSVLKSHPTRSVFFFWRENILLDILTTLLGLLRPDIEHTTFH